MTTAEVEISTVKVDSKGRIVLPPALRGELGMDAGDMVSIRRTGKSIVLVPARKSDFMSTYRRIIETPPTRRGRPENWNPSRMKGIWKRA